MKNYECNACDWRGPLSETLMCGSVGPLCPECHETTCEAMPTPNPDQPEKRARRLTMTEVQAPASEAEIDAMIAAEVDDDGKPLNPGFVAPAAQSKERPMQPASAEDQAVYDAIAARYSQKAQPADNHELDGTEAAHPAWWRSHDHTFAVMCEKLEKLLDGEPVVGATEPRWQRIRERIASLVAAQPAHEPPLAYNGCGCECHSRPGVVHVQACCYPTAIADVLFAAQPAAPQAQQEPTQDMVTAYLTANDAYWKEMDSMPLSDARKWRNGTPREATLVSLRAALAAAPQGQPEPVAYLIDWPDEPDLGHYFAEEASTTGRSRPLYLAPPASSVPAIDIDDRYAGRLALLLECMLIDPHGYWSEAAALLDEYKAEWERVNPSPPLFMGEPMPPERREILRKLREKRQAARAEGRSKPPNRAVARFLRAARPKAAPAH